MKAQLLSDTGMRIVNWCFDFKIMILNGIGAEDVQFKHTDVARVLKLKLGDLPGRHGGATLRSQPLAIFLLGQLQQGKQWANFRGL